MTSKKKLLSITAGVLVALGGTVAVIHANEKPGGHGHGGGHDHAAATGNGPASAGLKLDNGQKWKTDAPLREGMAGIHADLTAALDPIHAGNFTPENYSALAKGIEARVATIMATCKLPPDADAQIHLVLTDIYAGTSVMKKEGNRVNGVISTLRAVDAYGQYFDHPGLTAFAHK